MAERISNYPDYLNTPSPFTDRPDDVLRNAWNRYKWKDREIVDPAIQYVIQNLVEEIAADIVRPNSGGEHVDQSVYLWQTSITTMAGVKIKEAEYYISGTTVHEYVDENETTFVSFRTKDKRQVLALGKKGGVTSKEFAQLADGETTIDAAVITYVFDGATPRKYVHLSTLSSGNEKWGVLHGFTVKSIPLKETDLPMIHEILQNMRESLRTIAR